ncbi:four helix bundle protein [Treponema sp. R6D11]
MSIQNYQELIVWQKSMEIAELVYQTTKKLPKDELYSLTNQMRRAAVSIPSNIAEGQARHSTKEFIHFLRIAQGSKAELETQLLLCLKIGYLTDSDTEGIMNLLQEIGKMLTALISKLRESD